MTSHIFRERLILRAREAAWVYSLPTDPGKLTALCRFLHPLYHVEQLEAVVTHAETPDVDAIAEVCGRFGIPLRRELTGRRSSGYQNSSSRSPASTLLAFSTAAASRST